MAMMHHFWIGKLWTPGRPEIETMCTTGAQPQLARAIKRRALLGLSALSGMLSLSSYRRNCKQERSKEGPKGLRMDE